MRAFAATLALSIVAVLPRGGSAQCVETDDTVLADYAALTDGVSFVDLGDGPAPGEIALVGGTAFPLVRDEQGVIMAAAGRNGLGRATAFSHTDYFTRDVADSGVPDLLGNAVAWAAGGGSRVGVEAGRDALATRLRNAGFDVATIDVDDLAAFDVLLLDSSADLPPADVDAIAAWVRDGGGLLVAGTPWAVVDLDDFGADYIGNRLLAGSGIRFLHDYPYPQAGRDVIPAEPPCPWLNGGRALGALAAHLSGDSPLPNDELSIAASAASSAIAGASASDGDLLAAAADVRALLGDVVPSEADPVEPASEPLDTFVVNYDNRLAQTLPADQLVAHPASADFPGTVAEDAERVDATVEILATYRAFDPRRLYADPYEPALRSTGLYVPPGEVVEVEIGSRYVGGRLNARIGNLTDDIRVREAWTRFPEISRVWPLDAEVTRIASAFGGLLYVEVPDGASFGSIDVQVRGAVRAPWFVLDLTDPDDFAAAVRDAGAPYAELESDRFILTLPTARAANIDDPAGLMSFWNDVLDAGAELAAIGTGRARPERFALDRQISVGYMHSGYPLMGFETSWAELADLNLLTSEGAWGPFHELGHNHQWADWMLPGTTEVSVNLWSVYVYENVVGFEREDIREQTTAAFREQAITSYIDQGGQWTASIDVWTALQMYLQLQEAFGWEAFIDVFAEYNALPPGTVPDSDQARIDAWAERFAARVDHDLGPFFTCWGLPVSAPILNAMAQRAPWHDNPMLAWCGACGDGLVGPGEACDDGDANAPDGACLPDCTSAEPSDDAGETVDAGGSDDGGASLDDGDGGQGGDVTDDAGISSTQPGGCSAVPSAAPPMFLALVACAGWLRRRR